MSHLLRACSAVGVVATGLALLPAGAGAAAPPKAPPAPALAWAGAGAECTPLPTSKAFVKIDKDQADYSVSPGGDFEAGGVPWTLRGGARLTTGNEKLAISPGKRSLVMPVASTATSPKFCVDETNPHFRFAYKVDSLGKGFMARVTYQRADGLATVQLLSSQQLKIIPSTWQASPMSPLATHLPLRGGTATVQIQFLATSLAGGGIGGLASGISKGALTVPSVTIDSVMVDPLRRS